MRKLLLIFGALLAGSVAFAAESPRVFVGLDTKTVTNSWEGYFQDSFEWFAKDHHYKWVAEEAGGDPAVQITQCRQMINSGVKGLIVSAQDAEAAKPIVEFATASKVPVFTADADIDSPNVRMYVGFSGERAGEELTRHLVDFLKSEHQGQVRGTVLEMLGPEGGASSIQRSKGFHDVIDQYHDVKVIQAVGDFQEAPAKTAALNVLRANPSIDAVYSANGPMAVGAVEAMKDLNIDPLKVYTVSIDATPEVLTMIKSGEIRMALDQPPGFYTAIATHYLAAYLAKGEKALPKVGETITAKELNLNTRVKHAEVYPWADNAAWAPAKITSEFGHLWFQTGAIVVTKSNADAPFLWANIKLPPSNMASR
ncbi:MAG TPA: sugar ABC transporter substrate-binding protein [Anaeromyxobacteraceae bacterium]|nr:sugar ABC transporter substrate-binding protein [Anaeromyxobacteraceae bacterium]